MRGTTLSGSIHHHSLERLIGDICGEMMQVLTKLQKTICILSILLHRLRLGCIGKAEKKTPHESMAK